MKAEHRMGRNYLKGRDGDRINTVLAATGYNFSLLLRCLQRLLRAVMRILLATPAPAQNARTVSAYSGTDRLGGPAEKVNAPVSTSWPSTYRKQRGDASCGGLGWNRGGPGH